MTKVKLYFYLFLRAPPTTLNSLPSCVVQLMRSLNGSRKETVELVPLNEHLGSGGTTSPMDRPNGGGSALNGSIHSLVSNGVTELAHHQASIRMSASASALNSHTAAAAGSSNHHHHLASHHLSDSRSINSLTRSKHASSKSLNAIAMDQQQARARSGATGGAVGAGATANGTITTGEGGGANDVSEAGSNGASKRVSEDKMRSAKARVRCRQPPTNQPQATCVLPSFLTRAV